MLKWRNSRLLIFIINQNKKIAKNIKVVLIGAPDILRGIFHIELLLLLERRNMYKKIILFLFKIKIKEIAQLPVRV